MTPKWRSQAGQPIPDSLLSGGEEGADEAELSPLVSQLVMSLLILLALCWSTSSCYVLSHEKRLVLTFGDIDSALGRTPSGSVERG
uniref:Uncharacterized protein n=1 Tax=Timema monikensis TaxID=170555 RepID=A0A7R9HL83_9NEOP|nr:unnamed protein product [Timema monikensis]